jgi:hypothetical protein
MIEGKICAFNFFDGELEYQFQPLETHTYMRFYISSAGFSNMIALAIL